MQKKINIAITALFLAIILGFGAAFWIVPDTPRSADENRPLQTLPKITLATFLDGSLSGSLTDYFSDQFPLRGGFVGLHGIGEIAQMRGESNGVLYGRDGQLAVRRFDAYISRTERATDTDYYHPAHIEHSMASIARLRDSLAADGVPLTVLLAPRTIDVAASAFDYPSDLSDSLDRTVTAALDEAQVEQINLLDTFRQAYNAGEYVYYRTDHHWTTKGAYTAYAATLTAWGMEDEILPADAFEVRTVSDFYGTTYSRAGLYFIEPDTMEIWIARDGSDDRFAVKNGDGSPITEHGFIIESYLSEKDKYSAFLGEARSILTVTDTVAAERGEARPRLLIAKDSFANTVAPFLARHFDLVMVNVTGDKTDLTTLAAEYGCERVLILCNRENLVTTDCLLRLR